MKSFAFGFALLHLASLCYSAPSSVYVKARQEFESPVTFQGAGFTSYTLTLPFDGSTFTIDNPLSVSQIVADGPISGVCTFHGIDGSVTVLPAESTVDVGPPQTLLSGTCVLSNPPRRPRQLFIIALTTFTGAGSDPAHYFGAFTTEGAVQTISNPLSVSSISITDDSTGVTCTFFGINGSTTVVSFGETVDVGPPQVQVSAVCTTTA